MRFFFRDWQFWIVVVVSVVLGALTLAVVLQTEADAERQPGPWEWFGTFIDPPIAIGTFVVAVMLGIASLHARWRETLPLRMTVVFVHRGEDATPVRRRPIDGSGRCEGVGAVARSTVAILWSKGATPQDRFDLGYFEIEGPKVCKKLKVTVGGTGTNFDVHRRVWVRYGMTTKLGVTKSEGAKGTSGQEGAKGTSGQTDTAPAIPAIVPSSRGIEAPDWKNLPQVSRMAWRVSGKKWVASRATVRLAPVDAPIFLKLLVTHGLVRGINK